MDDAMKRRLSQLATDLRRMVVGFRWIAALAALGGIVGGMAVASASEASGAGDAQGLTIIVYGAVGAVGSYAASVFFHSLTVIIELLALRQ